MGNRAVITTAPHDDNKIAIYVQWNGGQESVEAFCKAAKELGYRDPTEDEAYGMARLVGLIALYFNITNDTSIGVGKCSDFGDPGDNGIWLIGKDWTLVGQPGKKKGKNPEPAKTTAIYKQLIVGARLCATTFTESLSIHADASKAA